MAESLTECARIRENIRRASAQDRLCHRQKAHSGKRNLSEIDEELKSQAVLSAEQITQLAIQIKQSSQTAVTDLRAVKQSLCSPQNITSFLCVTGALQALVRELSGQKALHQLEAAYIACNLGLGDEYSCSVVASAAGPYLIELLNSQSTVLQEACAWCLGNLAGGSSKALKVLQSQGLVSHLTSCLQSPHSDVVDATIYALCHILQTYLTSPESVPENEVQAIALATCGKVRNCISTHWLIFLLSCSGYCDGILIENSVLTFCMDFLHQNLHCMAVQPCDINTLRSLTSLLRAAANLCSEPSGRAAMFILKHPSFKPIMQSLSVSRHSHLQSESRWLATNLLFHPSSDAAIAARETGLILFQKGTT